MTAFRTERMLARMFFGRFFETEVMPAAPQVQLVIWSLAVLAAPGFMMAFQFGRGYAHLWQAPPAALVDAMLRDELLYVTYSVMALGLIAALTWEGVFPDRRDARVLGVLPIANRAHVVGRLAGLGAFAALFSVGINLPAAVAYGLVLFVYEVGAGPVRLVAAHLIATATAGAFAFFLLILAQGVLLTVLGRTMARRLALVVQIVFVVVLLQALNFVPLIASLAAAAFRDDQPSIAAWLPSVWFVVLYNVLAGTGHALPGAWALAAVAATVTVVLMGAGFIALSYRRLVRIALETPDGGADNRSKLLGRASKMVAALVHPGPVQRAVAGFTLRSLGHSRTHLSLLATDVGVAAALVLTTLIPLAVIGDLSILYTPNVVLLSVPLVCYFLVLLGLRALFGIPTEIKANWVFRFHAPGDRRPEIIAGVRLALLLAVVAPVAMVAGLVGMALWGVGPGAIHLGFNAALGTLLVEVVLIGLRKIPFACTYYPGRSRASTLWPLFLAAFVTYWYGLAGAEQAAMTSWLVTLVVLMSIVLVTAGMAWFRRLDPQAPPGLTYEEEDPGRIFEGFKLSEGLAAESAAARAGA